ncbi:MAG: hypothetical protein J6P46_01810, partial [Bacteroidales bacterium]|nr:hypothetical protein [Bacteroidales bacterium]
DPAYRFLAAGYTLSMEELVEEGIVPDNPCIKKSIIQDDWEEMPRYTLEEIGPYPSKRNDVFFMGIPASGKTCVLSGIVYELWQRGEVTYQPNNNERGKDLCQDYYFYLINAVRHCKVPVIVGTDVLCLMKLDVGKNRKMPMTMVKFSGEEFSKLASFYSEGKPLSDFYSVSLNCLANNNDKTLLFIVEYTHSLERIHSASETLYKAISFLDNTGPYRSNSNKDCPMRNVRSVAIIVTKSDLMGAGLSYDQRMTIATQFLGKHFGSFLSSMIQLCRKYNINELSNNEVVVFPFTLGTFYLGNTFQFNNEDSKRLIDFLESETGKRKRQKYIIK